MTIAILSDIHGNPAALLKVLDDAKNHGCERFICLGDIVGYGYDPNTCIDICKEKGIECILGNHDAAVIEKLSLVWFSECAQDGVMRHRLAIDKARKEWLRSLQYQKKEDFGSWRCCFSHGTFSFPEEYEYIQGVGEALLEMEMMATNGCDILFVGHTHYAESFAISLDGDLSVLDTVNSPNLTINPNNYERLIVNVGSVGYPRNQPYSYYVIFDTVEQMITYRQLPFDFVSYVAEMQKREIRIPSWVQLQIEKAKGE